MAPTKLVQALQDNRWRPYLLGCLAGVPIAVIMLQVWKNWDYLAWAWLGLFMLCAGLVPRKRPIAKLILTALAVGTLVPLVIR
jgi:uncharacterized membrane protein YccC